MRHLLVFNDKNGFWETAWPAPQAFPSDLRRCEGCAYTMECLVLYHWSPLGIISRARFDEMHDIGPVVLADPPDEDAEVVAHGVDDDSGHSTIYDVPSTCPKYDPGNTGVIHEAQQSMQAMPAQPALP